MSGSRKARGPFVCACCSKEYFTGREKGQGEKYCSRACYFEWIGRNKRTHDRSLPRAVAARYREHIKRGYRLKPKRQWDAMYWWTKRVKGKQMQCAVCKTVWCPLYGWGTARTCSVSCAADLARDAYKRTKDRRRARKRGAAVEPVSRLRVFERDGWRCKACSAGTPKHLMGTLDDNAPELDHIVALSVGGEHSYANTQCLCRVCNILKADSSMQSFIARWCTGGASNGRAFSKETGASQPQRYFPPNGL